MTIYVPISGENEPPANAPSFVQGCSDPSAKLAKIVKEIVKARRVVVISGAGISTQAGIPDFRSSDGLFQSLKRDSPVSSGKDLFDASVFSSEQTTLLFFQMIARLSSISSSAQPTDFHKVLKSLDGLGNLLRVYTQNIDAIEAKSGLSFGVPLPKSRASTSHIKHSIGGLNTPPASRVPSPVPEMPKCIPLHGTLQSLHCQACTHSFPLDKFLPTLSSGTPPHCPECAAMEETRALVGKRARGVGKLRPDIVLYNEIHRDGEGVGEAVRKDLTGTKNRAGADLLLVVGTSLQVPGTKRIVREFSKAVKHRCRSQSPPSTFSSGPTLRSYRPEGTEEEEQLKSIYLNFDFPVPTREWDGVFDAWVHGDVQNFARMLQEEVNNAVRRREIRAEKKRKREEGKEREPEVQRKRPKKAIKSTDSKSSKKRRTIKRSSRIPSRSATEPPQSKRRKIEFSPETPKKSRIGLATPPPSPPSPQSWSVPPNTSEEEPSERLVIRIPPRLPAISNRAYVEVPPAPPPVPQTPLSKRFGGFPGVFPLTPCSISRNKR